MNRTTFFFFYALACSLFLPCIYSRAHLLYFAPFLVIAIYNTSKYSCLWWAFLCGLIIDLLSAQTRPGIFALNYCIAVQILYPYKRHFFEDSLSTFPIMTFLFSSLSGLIHVPLYYLFGPSFSFSVRWFIDDLIGMPLLDSLYAAIGFTLPYLFFPKAIKKKPVLFSSKNRSKENYR